MAAVVHRFSVEWAPILLVVAIQWMVMPALDGESALAMNGLLKMEPQSDVPLLSDPKQDAQPGGPNWGAAVEGVQVALRATKPEWEEGAVPRLVAAVRNGGVRNLRITPLGRLCELEVDGRWYRRPPNTREARPRPSPFGPGRGYGDIAVDLDSRWEDAFAPARGPGAAGPLRLALAPGKHTVRVAFTATAAPGDPGKAVTALSQLVEIMVVPAREPARGG